MACFIVELVIQRDASPGVWHAGGACSSCSSGRCRGRHEARTGAGKRGLRTSVVFHRGFQHYCMSGGYPRLVPVSVLITVGARRYIMC
jgi:hypothetical protein